MSQSKGRTEAKLYEPVTLDLAPYIRTVKSYLSPIILISILVAILAAIIVNSVTPQYKATATMLIESDQAKVLSIEEIYGIDSSRKEYFKTQFEILKSRKIAEKVIDKIRLFEHPTFNPDYKPEQTGFIPKSIQSIKESIREWVPFLSEKEVPTSSEADALIRQKRFAVAKFMRVLQVKPLVNTQLVELEFEHQDPQLAAIIANTVGNMYIENYLEAKFDMTAKAAKWLNESLQGLRSKLVKAETRLSDFYEREKLVDIDGVVGLASEELQQLSELLLEAQSGLKRNEKSYLLVSSNDVDMATLESLPEVLNNPSIQNAKKAELTAESRVSEVKKIFGPKHPNMIAANAELASIRSSLTYQMRVLVNGIKTEYSNALAKVTELEKAVEEAKQEYRKLSNLENERKTLLREVEINQQIYNSFFTRSKETAELGGFESANARLIDEAIPPTSPSKPKKNQIIAASFLASFVFCVLVAFTREALNSVIRSVDDVERKLGQRVLGIVPWQPHNKEKNLPLRHFFDKNYHTFSESIRTLRTSLQLLNMDKAAKTILVTSSLPKEGKSTVSVNLAFAMGQLNKVLLIDSDLRRSSLSKQFGLPDEQPGLVNLIAGSHTIDECIVNDTGSNIDLICAGTLPSNPQELLASETFITLIEDLKDQYDHIIIDSAPTEAVSDAIIVSKVCDSVVFVVKIDGTSDKVVNNSLSRFMQIGHKVDGIVLNQVDLTEAKKTGEYAGFYDQYGYHSQQKDNHIG